MKPDRALAELKALKDAAATSEVQESGAAHDTWKAKTVAVMSQVLGKESATLKRFDEVRYHIGFYTGAPGEHERDQRYFAKQVTRAAALIDAAIYEVELAMDGDQPDPVRPTATGVKTTIFLVHGHDDAAKLDVARFVEKVTGSAAVILHEQANQGKTLVEKFEAHAADATYAIVLLTPDDVGRVRGTDSATDSPRARQNVVFELGFFFGKLGRNRVAVLNKGVEKPSDVDGLAYITYPAGNWQVDLAKELHSAGVPVDMTKLF